jgi:hypothetical protein
LLVARMRAAIFFVLPRTWGSRPPARPARRKGSRGGGKPAGYKDLYTRGGPRASHPTRELPLGEVAQLRIDVRGRVLGLRRRLALS